MGTFQVPGRISGQTYNLKIKGDTPSPTEQARIRAFVEEKENSFAADYEARYGAPLTVDDGTAIGRGFELGKAGAYSRLGTATEYLGSGLGLESLADFGRGMRESGDQETFLETLRQPAPTQLEDVKGLGSFLTYAGEGIGQSGPEMLAPLAATGIGTLVGGPVAGVGAGAVTAFPSFFGGNIQRQEEEVAAGRKDKVDVTDAVISAVGQSALNAIGDKLLLGGFLKPGQKWLTRAAVGAGEGAASEIPSEIAQSIIERKQAGLALDDDEAINEYINAGVLAGVMGGGVRATTAGLGLGMEKETPPPLLRLPPPALITPPPGTPPSVPSADTSTDVSTAPEPPAEVIPDEAYAEDAKAGAGTNTQQDLEDVVGVYDELLANEKAKGTNPDEAERIAASSTLSYIDTLPEATKQRLSPYRANMAKYASIPESLPDEAYSELGAETPDLFTAAPTAAPTVKLEDIPVADIETDPFVLAESEGTAAGTSLAAKLKAQEDEAKKVQAEVVKPAQVLTNELVTQMGVGTAKSASLRGLVGQPLTDTKVIRALDRWAQNGNAPAEGAALAARLIGQPDLFGAPQAAPEVESQQATTQEAPNVGEGTEAQLAETGVGTEGSTQSVGEGTGAGSEGQATEVTATSGTGRLDTDQSNTLDAGAAGAAQQDTLDSLVDQLAAARAEAEVARRKVPAGVMERKPVGGVVDPTLLKAVTNLNNVLVRQEKAVETTKNAFSRTKVSSPTRDARLKKYSSAIAAVNETRSQLAAAQEAVRNAELRAGLSRDVQPIAQTDAKSQAAETAYKKALSKADALAKRVETARARQVEEAQAPVLPTGLREPVVPDVFLTFQRGFTTKPIAPADAPRSAAESVRAENILRRLTEGFLERTTLAYRKFTSGRRGINSESSWETNPDWVPLDDQIKVLALLGRVDILQQFKIAKADLEPGEVTLTTEERAARVYFSKTIRPVDAIAMMVQDLTVGYEKYEVSEDVVTIKGIGNVESLLSQGTGSVPATNALNWVRANLSAKTNGAVDLSIKKQAEQNAKLEGFVGAEGGTDRVEEQRANRRAVKAAQAADADTSGYGAMEMAARMAAGDSRIALDQGLHYSVKAALDSGDLKGALLALAATTNNAELKALASRFAELTGTTRIKVLYPGDSARNIGSNAGIYWQYDGNNLSDLERRNIIYLNGQIGMTAHVLTHEVAHALSSNFIETQPNHPIVKELEALLVMLRNKVSVRVAGAPGDFYGLRNVKELVAEAYGRISLGETDNGLRDLMKQVVLTTEIGIEFDKPLTAWERFQEIAANIINVVMGRPRTKRPRTKLKDTVLKYETATEKFHRLFDGILSEAPEVLPDSVLQRAVSSPMVAKNVLNNAIKSAPIWDSAGRKRLSDLMMSSVPIPLRRALMAPLQLEWFNDLAGKYFPQIAELKVIDDLRRGNIRRLEQAAEPVLTDLVKYAEKSPELYSQLMSIMGTSTRLEVDPTKPQSAYAADPEKIRIWHDLNRQIRTSDTTGDMRKLFKTTRSLFEAYRNEILDVLRSRVKDLTDDVTTQNQIFKRLVDKLDADGVIDPYFSLMRRGDFWLVYTAEDNTAAAVALDPFGRPKRPTTQYVQSFTSAWARNSFRAKLETTKNADGDPVAWDIKEDRRPKQDRNLRGSVPLPFMQGALNILDSTVPKLTRDPAAEQRAANARTAIEDLFLSFVPETSILQSLNKRKGTRGFIGDITPIGVVDRPLDMIGALNNKSHAIAFQLSNMKYGADIQRLMNKSGETLAALKDAGLTAGESVAVEAYHEEFMERAAYAKSPTISKFWQTTRGLTFGFTLGGNISGMVNNLLQIPAIGIPELAGRYGMREAQRQLRFAASTILHAGKTQNVLSYGPDGQTAREIDSIDNYGSLGNYYIPTVKKDPQTGEETFSLVLRTDMNIPAKLQAKLKDMDVLAEIMANNDMLGGSTNQELLDATSDWWRTINRWSGFGMHHTERFNRQTMAIATYNLELGKRAAGSAAPDYATKLAAAKKAIEITERVNGSIGAAQGSRAGFGGIGSLIMMYKRFGLMMTRYLINNVKQSLKRVTPGMSPAEIEEVKAERAVARYQTIGIIGAAALFSGAQGLPFFSEVMTLIDLLFTDDDEEPAKVVVQKFLGEPYYNGALNYLLGIEIASRISLSGLVFRENMIERDQPILYDAIEMFGGPAVGILSNLDRGYGLIEEGELYRGLEAMAPSAVKNLMKAGRFGTEGATTLRGDEIVPLSGLDVVKQAIGYTPESYARQQQRTSVTKRVDEAIRNKKRKLLRRYNQAIESRDFAEVREILLDMKEFSREYPEDAILPKTLERSVTGFQQRSDEMIGGVSFNQLERARRDIGEFDEDTTLWADVVQ